MTRTTGTLHEDVCTCVTVCRSILRIRIFFRHSSGENQNTSFMFNNFFGRKSWLLLDNVEECGTARQTKDDNMEHAPCMLDTKGYTHRLRICNTYGFSKVGMVTRTRLKKRLYIHCLPCLYLFLIYWFFVIHVHLFFWGGWGSLVGIVT